MTINEAPHQTVTYKTNEIMALLKGSKAILAHKDFETSAKLIFDTCKELIGAQAGYIALLSDDGSENEVLFLDPGEMNCTVDESLPMPIRGLRAEAYQKGTAVYHNDFAHSDFVKYMPEGHVHLQNVLFAPLIIEGNAVGLMGLSNKPDDFNDHDAELASAFGEYAAIALNNSRMLDKLNKAKSELEDFNQKLEQRIEKRTQEINHLLQQKDAFIDQLSHDLSHPLGPLINLIPLLKKGETDERRKEMINIIERNVAYLQQLVKRTVQLTKLNAPSTTFNCKSINVNDFLKNIIEKKMDLFNEHHIEIKQQVNENILLQADEKQIAEVFDILFSNAVKYGAENGSIYIRVENQDDHFAIISVEDTGDGMNKEQLTYAFHEFYKADESRHDFNDTGLGLPICKRIIEMHGGHIWVESDGLGNGSTFYFTLPLNTKQEEEP